MKSIVTGIACTLLLSFTASAQVGWFVQDQVFPNLIWIDVDFVDTEFGICVGFEGKAQRTTNGGANWEPLTTGVDVNLNAVCMVDKSIGYAVGHSGTVLKTTNGGSSWDKIETNVTNTLLDCWFFDENTGFVSGSRALLARTDDGGKTWSAQSARVGQNNINSIHAFSRDELIICGNDGSVAKTENGGGKWSKISVGVPVDALNAVSFAVDVGTIVGSGVIILGSTDRGETWTQQMPDAPLGSIPLTDVVHVTENTAYACGWLGALLRSPDGGSWWVVQQSPNGENYEGLDFADEKTGWCVGWNGSIIATVNGGTLDVEPMDAAPHSVALLDIYPHPASISQTQEMKFTFSLPTRTSFSLQIFDLLGNRVANIASDNLPTGTYSASWQPVDMKNGVYFAVLETPDVRLSKKLLLTK